MTLIPEFTWDVFCAVCVGQDAFAKGEVFMGHRDHGYRVTIGLPAGTHYNGSWQYGITIQTPERSFLFTCETDLEQKDWMRHFNDVISTPMSPQEYTGNTSQHTDLIHVHVCESENM